MRALIAGVIVLLGGLLHACAPASAPPAREGTPDPPSSAPLPAPPVPREGTAAPVVERLRARDLPPLPEPEQCALSPASVPPEATEMGGAFLSFLPGDPRFRSDVPGPCKETIEREGQVVAEIPYRYEGGRFQETGSPPPKMFRRYDAEGRPLSFGDAATGKAWGTYHYDACGKLASYDYFQRRTFTYDAMGRLVRYEHPGHFGGVFTYAGGRIDTLEAGPGEADDRREISTLFYDRAGRVVATETRTGAGLVTRRLSLRYDEAGHCTERREDTPTNGSTIVERWTFDVRGRVLSRTFVSADGSAVTTRFDYGCW